MLKNLLCFIGAGLFGLTASAQTKWVGFSQKEPAAPDVNVLSSNAREVVFEITIPGIHTMDTVVNGTTFTRLILPGGFAVAPSGSPEAPVLSYKVAIPDCDGVVLSYSVISKQKMPSCWVYPMPQFVLGKNDEIVEQFMFDSTAYTQLYAPEPAAVITSDGKFREQHYSNVMVKVAEFCPVARQLTIIDKVEITLTFKNPTGDLIHDLNIFSKIASNTFVNYPDNGMNALHFDKAFEKPGFTRGNVQWITITDTDQADTISCDYLIVTVPEFFEPNNPNSQLLRLAEHRAWYNSYNVTILNIEDILLLDFECENPIPSYKNEQRLRTCIRRIYEGANAPNTGHLAFVLLVGDYENGVGIPTATEHGVYNANYTDGVYPSDYYYTCITKDAGGQYDPEGDLAIGRFSVETEPQLFNMVQKTIYHETGSTGAWRKTAGFTTHRSPYYTSYLNFAENLMINIGWDYSIVNGWQLDGAITIPTMNYLNEGVIFVQKLGVHPDPHNSWGDDLDIPYFLNNLSNDYMVPFISTAGSRSAQFDNDECLGEFLTRYDSIKGAVGYIGATRNMHLHYTGTNLYQEDFITHLFSEDYVIAGELLLKTKTSEDISSTYAKQRRYSYNLLGDPALNILAEGIDGCVEAITMLTQIPSGSAFVVDDDCTLYIHQNGKLVIEEGGSLVLGNRVKVIGVNNSITDAIHIKGGVFTVGDDVTFTDLPGGILLENNGKKTYDDNLQYYLNNATFTNTPLRHRGTKLHLYNVVSLNRSDVITSNSKVNIQNCHFTESGFFAEHKSVSSFETLFISYVQITGSDFKNTGQFITGYDKLGLPIYSTAAVGLDGIKEFYISSNTIVNVEQNCPLFGEGIYLNESGTGNDNNVQISDNNVTACETGIYLYHSKAKFYNNHIHNNYYGVRLFNCSSSHFVGEPYPINGEQIIRDNISYELYASYYTFPYPFIYNQIIDEDNIGNPYDPMIYYDDISQNIVAPLDVSCNYWGTSFNIIDDLFPHTMYILNSIWGKNGPCSKSDGKGLYDDGIDYFANENYTAAKAAFLELISTYPDDPFSISSLHQLFSLEQFLDNDYAALHNYYASFSPTDSNLFYVADFLATRCNVVIQNWQPAINWYEGRIEEPPSYQDSVFAVIDLGDIHLMMEDDSLKACRVFRFPNIKPKSRQQYEENKSALLATLPKVDQPRPQHPLAETGKKGILSQNIPNPAKESTTIVYDVIEEGSVHLRIYNQLGQLLQDFPQGTKKPGSYRLEVSLVGMPAGVYHYVLFVEGEKADGKKLIVN